MFWRSENVQKCHHNFCFLILVLNFKVQINHSQSVRYPHSLFSLYLILTVSFAHITFCVLVSYLFIYFLRLLLHVNHVQPICTFLSCTVMLILIFKSIVYYHAHYFIFYILFFISFLIFFIHLILCILLCVVFYNIALSMERTWLTFHCWLILSV